MTTELDMFNPHADFPTWVAQRRGLTRTDKADLWSAGFGATVAGGHPSQLGPPGTIPVLARGERARAFVADRVKEGSDYLKIFVEDLSEFADGTSMPTLDASQVCDLIAAAHRQGKLAVVHAQAERLAREAIACGADGLTHTFPDRLADASFSRAMTRRGAFMMTTLALWADQSGGDAAVRLASDARVAPYFSASQRKWLTQRDKTVFPDFYPNAVANVRLLHRAGVRILAGSDAPNPGTAHGIGLHQELRMLVDGCLTPLQALGAATSVPAAAFKLVGRGRIKSGGRADAVLVRGDPTLDIDDTLDIQRIWKNGYPVDRTPAAEPPASSS